MSKRMKIILVILSLVWLLTNLPAVFYGTKDIALHVSYIGDEQAPINGALKILQDKSLLGLRNAKTVYYGPIFSILALPAVVVDLAEKAVFDGVRSAADYRDHILWDWGGIVWKARLISLFFCFLIFVLIFKLFSTQSFNPKDSAYLPLIITVLAATNFLFFEYGHFFRHWIFVLFSLVGMLYTLVRLYEGGSKKYFVYSAAFTLFGFGVSYLSILFLVMWIPLLYVWIRNKKYRELKSFAIFSVALLVLGAIIVFWNPHPFLRIVGLTGGDIVNTDTSDLSSELTPVGFSFGYYARILLNNILPSLLALLVALIFLCRKAEFYKNFPLYLLATPAIVCFILFGLIGHHESRYILPIILLLNILVGYTLSHVLIHRDSLNRYVVLSVITLVSCSCAYNIFLIGAYTNIISKGPLEMKLIEEIRALQKEKSDSKTLVAKHYLLGAPHTKDAYRDYMEWSNKTKVNLYNFILSSDISEEKNPLSVYYVIPPKFTVTSELLDSYDHVVFYYNFSYEQKTEPDYFDVNPLNLLYSTELSDSYYFIK